MLFKNFLKISHLIQEIILLLSSQNIFSKRFIILYYHFNLFIRRMIRLSYLNMLFICINFVIAADFGFQSSGLIEPSQFYALKGKSLTGNKEISFDQFKNKVVMITNVASECGYTAQNYEQLAQLKNEFKDDLAIILIPSNDFGGQEPGTSDEIASFIKTHGGENYFVLNKSKMNGPDQDPLIAFLKVSL